MNGNDELNDSAVLSAVRDSISGMPMPAAPRLQAITARGRAHRRRRLGGLSIAGAGACAALAVGLACGSARSPPGQRHSTRRLRSIWRRSRSPPARGTTTLTLYPRQVINPDAVRQALAEHGFPALVTAGKFRRTADQPSARRWPGGGAAAPEAAGDRRAAARPAEDRGPARS